MIPHNISEFLRAWVRGVEIYADPYALTSSPDDVTTGEQERFDELGEEQLQIVEAATMRIKIRVQAISKAQQDYVYAHDAYLDALVSLDVEDDYQSDYEHKERLKQYQADYEQKSVRMNFELRDSAKVGITPARSY